MPIVFVSHCESLSYKRVKNERKKMSEIKSLNGIWVYAHWAAKTFAYITTEHFVWNKQTEWERLKQNGRKKNKQIVNSIETITVNELICFIWCNSTRIDWRTRRERVHRRHLVIALFHGNNSCVRKWNVNFVWFCRLIIDQRIRIGRS